MIIDLHCHTKYSHDCYLEPADLIHRARELGLDGVCITEHHSYTISSAVTDKRQGDGFVIFRGLEISTNMGHLLAYGVRDDSWNTWGRDNYLDIVEVIRNIHLNEGICVPAHPFRGWDSLGNALFTLDGFDAVETHNGCNGLDENEKAIHAASTLNLPSIGGSDCHGIEEVGRTCTEFPNPVRTIDDMIGEIKRGNCRGIYIR
jgi:predicted metal-dependent phosphoesterase TrpH